MAARQGSVCATGDVRAGGRAGVWACRREGGRGGGLEGVGVSSAFGAKGHSVEAGGHAARRDQGETAVLRDGQTLQGGQTGGSRTADAAQTRYGASAKEDLESGDLAAGRLLSAHYCARPLRQAGRRANHQPYPWIHATAA